ncbi:hypothetical protein KFL_002610020 [Klebsormidium nitens]|uniref:Uncharacterized protein n=1 Tax=Klebsormidium nitens TaxID=105231 RepID=A0A1Y1IB39_KLENI|nr:hypothetical protein KFL_002610020 [Klebsormidium nitens]|eukprot:GAQ85916.1 hypothetical protein KFL_002610020 [Klebsormidium nitens]
MDNVPRLSSLTLEELSVLGTDEGNEIKVDFDMPERSSWLQEILKELKSKDEGSRMMALWRFKETYGDLLFNESRLRQGGERSAGVNVSILMLTRGMAQEIGRGLTDAALTGRWYFIPKDALDVQAAGKTVDIYSRVTIYCSVLEMLVVDGRTFKHFLSEVPNLFPVLANIFMRAYSLAEMYVQPRDWSDPGIQSRKGIVRAISTLFIWAKPRHIQEVASLHDFLLCLMQQCKENLEDIEFVHFACLVISTVLDNSRDLSSGALLAALMDLISSLLSRGTMPRTLQRACCCLISLFNKETEGDFEVCQHLAGQLRSSFRQSFLALAVCKEIDSSMQEFAQHMTAILCDLVLDDTKESENQVAVAIAQMACKDVGAQGRLQELIEMSRRPAEGRELLLGPMRPLPWGKGNERLNLSEGGIDWTIRDRPYRKCARPECERVESSINEFLVCGGCRLACYCGRAEHFLLGFLSNAGPKRVCVPSASRRSSTMVSVWQGLQLHKT